MVQPFIFPEPVNALAQIGYGRQLRQQQQEGERQNALIERFKTADINTSGGRDALVQDVFKFDPEKALKLKDQFYRWEEGTRQQARDKARDAGRYALQIKNAPPESRAALWAQAGVHSDAFNGHYVPGAEDSILIEAKTFEEMNAEHQAQMAAAMEAPKTREVTRGGMTVTEEWNPTTRTWAEVGSGPRFAPTQARAPTEMETWTKWLNSDDPRLKKAAEQHFKLNGGNEEWHEAIGQGGVAYKYNDAGQTNLQRPTGGFYSLDELGGQVPEGQPLVPRTQQPGGGKPVDLSQYVKPGDESAFEAWRAAYIREHEKEPGATDIARWNKQQTGDEGPFGGASMDAQAYNLVYAYETKKGRKEATTPEEDYAYRLAKNHLNNVKIQTTPAGEAFTIQPQPVPSIGEPAADGGATTPTITPIDLGAPKKLKELEQNVSRIRQSTDRYEKLLDDVGEGPLLNLTNRGGAALIEQAYNDLMLEAKEAYNLGVLNGPDYQILTTTLTPPTGIGAATLNKSELKAQLQQFRAKIDGIISSAQSIYAPGGGQSSATSIQEWVRDANGKLVPKQ